MKQTLLHNPYKQQVASATSSKNQRKNIWEQDIRIGAPWGMKDKQQFFYLLGMLLQSGLGLLESLQVLQEQLKRKNSQKKIEDIHLQLEGGMAFSEILASSPSYFSAFDIQTLHMGEQTGQMAGMLHELGQFYQRRLSLRRKLGQALSYPIAVIGVAVLVLSFMLSFVVPMFQDVFKRFDAELPPITQGILQLSAFFQAYGGYMLMGMGLLIGSVSLLRKRKAFRRLSSWLVVRIPLVGSLILKLQLARLSYSLGLLLTAKVKLDQALDSCAKLISFYPIQQALIQAKEEVLQGISLFQALKKQGIFPAYLLQMVRVGEKTARLGELLSSTAEQLEEESQSSMGQLTQLLEPVLIVVLGSLVAFMLVALYLPMFELGNTIMNY